MSRTGPEFVESESEMRNDINRKQRNGDLSEEAANFFLELYDFANELGDSVKIGGAKSANFQMKVNAHQGDYPGTASVFTVSTERGLKVWPAGRPYTNESLPASVGWVEQDYKDYVKEFQSLIGVSRGETDVSLETASSHIDIDRFKMIVTEFVTTCREQSSDSDV